MQEQNNINNMEFMKLSQKETPKFIKFIIQKPSETSSTKDESEKKRSYKDKDFSSTSYSFTQEDKTSKGRWTKEEHKKFVEAIMIYGNDWKKIQYYIGTRTETQARSHAQKYILKLKRNPIIIEKKINMSLPWTKLIQIIRKTFTLEEFKSIQQKKNRINKKILKIRRRSSYSFYKEKEEPLNYIDFSYEKSEEEKQNDKEYENFMLNFDNNKFEWSEDEDDRELNQIYYNPFSNYKNKEDFINNVE